MLFAVADSVAGFALLAALAVMIGIGALVVSCE